MHMRNCISSRACEVYVRMRLAARVPEQAARRWLGQSGDFPHANNDGPGLDGPGTRPAVGPMRSQIAASGLIPECTRPVVPNGNALMMRMRSFWVNGGPCLVKMLW